MIEIESKPTLEYRAAADDYRQVNQRLTQWARHAVLTVMFVVFGCLFVSAVLVGLMMIVVAAAEQNTGMGLLALGVAGMAAMFFAAARGIERAMNR